MDSIPFSTALVLTGIVQCTLRSKNDSAGFASLISLKLVEIKIEYDERSRRLLIGSFHDQQ